MKPSVITKVSNQIFGSSKQIKAGIAPAGDSLRGAGAEMGVGVGFVIPTAEPDVEASFRGTDRDMDGQPKTSRSQTDQAAFKMW
jgi:hypothetical protein